MNRVLQNSENRKRCNFNNANLSPSYAKTRTQAQNRSYWIHKARIHYCCSPFLIIPTISDFNAMLVMPSVLLFPVLFLLLTVPVCSLPIAAKEADKGIFSKRIAPNKIDLWKRSLFPRDRFCVHLSRLTTSKCPAQYLTSSADCTDAFCMLCFLCQRAKYLPPRGTSHKGKPVSKDDRKAKESKENCWVCAYEITDCPPSCPYRCKDFDWTCTFHYVQSNGSI